MAEITIRPGREDDLEFLVWVMFTAAKSHLDRCFWELMFDKDEAWIREMLRRVALSETPHWCHLSKFWIAEIGSAQAGALAGFDPASEGNDALTPTMLAAVSEMGAEDIDLPGTLARAALADSCTPKNYPGAWGVENVAVLPQFRGLGVVDRLMDHVLEEGRRRGYEHAQILCLNGNVRALKSWERSGFELRGDYRSSDFEAAFGCAGLKLLAQRLG